MTVSNTPIPTANSPGSRSAELQRLLWCDAKNREWAVQLTPDAVSFVSAERVLRIASADWRRDIHLIPHKDAMIVRIERFDDSLAFVVAPGEFEDFVQHVAGRAVAPSLAESSEADRPARRVMTPKVSRLSIGALALSAFSFVPVVGWLTSIAAVILLVLHRVRIRGEEFAHSRRVCIASMIWLAIGLAISGLVARGILRNNHAAAPEKFGDAPTRLSVIEIGAAVGADQTATSGVSSQELSDRSHAFGELDHQTRMLRTEAEGVRPLAEREYDWALIAAVVIIVVLSLSIHECAHAITSWWFGDDFAHREGRVTLNPLAHIDPVGTIAIPLFLFMIDAGVWGWAKPVPVMTHNLRKPRSAMIWISLAGPASNLLIALASLMLLLGIGCVVDQFLPDAKLDSFTNPGIHSMVAASGLPGGRVIGLTCSMLKASFIINILLALFNLIPIPPLDGSKILMGVFPRSVGAMYDRLGPYSTLIFLAFIYSGASRILIYPARYLIGPGFDLLTASTPF